MNDQLPEAFSLLGYAFYLQPLIMPIIREMPEGKSGRQALTAAVHSSLLGECVVLLLWADGPWPSRLLQLCPACDRRPLAGDECLCC